MSAVETKKIVDAIKKILTELSKLDDEQIGKVISGELKFKFESKTSSTKTTKAPKIDLKDTAIFEKLKNELYACTSRSEAIDFVTNLNMNITQIKEFAKLLGSMTPNAKGKEEVIKVFVNNTVGARLDTASIHRT